MPTAQLKQFAKKSQTFVSLYRSVQFYSGASMRDFLDRDKARIISLARPYTMLSWRELSRLYEAAAELERDGVRGAFVELGVCNGGSAGVLSAVARANPERHVWMFDSWQGLPAPTEEDVNCLGEQGEEGICLGSERRVRELVFEKLGSSPERNHLVKGWFDSTVPARKADIGPIALLHLDGDWYSSVKVCLEELYDQVVEGGYVVLDDYGYWQGAKRAVDEFLAARRISARIERVDATAAFFRKPAG